MQAQSAQKNRLADYEKVQADVGTEIALLNEQAQVATAYAEEVGKLPKITKGTIRTVSVRPEGRGELLDWLDQSYAQQRELRKMGFDWSMNCSRVSVKEIFLAAGSQAYSLALPGARASTAKPIIIMPLRLEVQSFITSERLDNMFRRYVSIPGSFMQAVERDAMVSLSNPWENEHIPCRSRDILANLIHASYRDERLDGLLFPRNLSTVSVRVRIDHESRARLYLMISGALADVRYPARNLPPSESRQTILNLYRRGYGCVSVTGVGHTSLRTTSELAGDEPA